MNKVELIKAVAEATNNTQKDIKVIMEAVQDVTYGALVEGDEVKLMDGVTLSVQVIGIVWLLEMLGLIQNIFLYVRLLV